MNLLNNKKIKFMSINDPHITRLVFLIALWMIFIAITRFGKFYTVLNFQTMASQFPEFGLMALGVMLCMLTGGIDLSVVGIANMTSIIVAFILLSLTGEGGTLPAFSILLVFILAIMIGAIAGIFNGVLVSKLNIPPILATMGSGALFTGISVVLTNGNAVSKFSRAYSQTINNKLGGVIPVQLIFFIVMAVFIWFLLSKTVFGTKLYMLGTSPTAARFSGLKITKLLIKTYMLSGITAALGGMIMLANYNSARADYGSVYTLQTVLIVVLGGVDPLGGKGKISGVVLAIILLRMLETGINRFPHISSYYISLIWGSVLLLVMVLNYFSVNKKPVVKE
ncbi:ABC transporter permease [Oceanispirochaeta crateris]|uniref:ABC transporter permease n=1 Tax=Oceanispirochaeta crateris TaxID=2518645 RepID=A0A5C1QP20_9SPIO|nr:ABC transporter permease [Oceanispirochaeta crateris]QEN08979.1 ABC transporter permease [Oceanispirochaeta crateris]